MTSEYGYNAKKRKKPRLMTLKSSDVGGRHYVEVSIMPKTTQDEIALAQVAQALRTPGADGRPMMSDEDINRYIFGRKHPERISESVDMQMLASQDEEVADVRRKAAVELWKKRNPDVVKMAMNPEGEEIVMMTKTEFTEFVNATVQAKMAEAQGVPVTQMLGQAMMNQQGADQGAPPGAAPAGMPMPGMGGGMAQAGLPSQFSMTPAEEIPEPAANAARKARRGKAANNPKKPKGNY